MLALSLLFPGSRASKVSFASSGSRSRGSLDRILNPSPVPPSPARKEEQGLVAAHLVPADGDAVGIELQENFHDGRASPRGGDMHARVALLLTQQQHRNEVNVETRLRNKRTTTARGEKNYKVRTGQWFPEENGPESESPMATLGVVTGIGTPRKYVFDVTSVGQRKYVWRHFYWSTFVASNTSSDRLITLKFWLLNGIGGETSAMLNQVKQVWQVTAFCCRTTSGFSSKISATTSEWSFSAA